MITGDAELRGPSTGTPGTTHQASAVPTGGRRPGNLVSAHWRGELPMPLSFWGGWGLIGGLGCLAAGALLTQVGITAGPVRWAALGALLGWPLVLLVQAWGGVGAWRSAVAWCREGRRALWGHGCRLAVAASGAAIVFSTGLHFVPQVPALMRILLGSDPRGQALATLADDGHRLQLTGWLGIGDAARVQQVIATAPQVRVLEIDSPGGRLEEARRLADALRGQGWTVRVRGACLDACTVVFMAGQVRQLLPGAQWSVHRPPAAVFNPFLARLAQWQLATLYRQAGVPDGLVKTMLAMPPGRRWTSTWDELAGAGVVSARAYPLDVDVPSPRDTPAIEFAEALRTNPIWQALDRRFPGLIGEAAERMRIARDSGATDELLMLMAQGGVEERLPHLLFNAGPELREQYVVLLAQQIQAAHDIGMHRIASVIKGDRVARRALPPALAVRESAWLADAAAEPLRQAPARRPTSTELEVVRRSLGADAPALLAGWRRAGDADARHLERIATLLADVLRLPHPERRLAIRLMFEQP